MVKWRNDGVEIAIKVGSAGLKDMKNVIDFMVALLEREMNKQYIDWRKIKY